MSAILENENNTMVFLCTVDNKTKRQTIKASSGMLLIAANAYDNFMNECDPLFDATAVKHKAQTNADITHIPL